MLTDLWSSRQASSLCKSQLTIPWKSLMSGFLPVMLADKHTSEHFDSRQSHWLNYWPCLWGGQMTYMLCNSCIVKTWPLGVRVKDELYCDSIHSLKHSLGEDHCRRDIKIPLPMDKYCQWSSYEYDDELSLPQLKCVCACVCIWHTQTHMQTQTHNHTHTHTCKHNHKHTQMHTHTNTHVHTHTSTQCWLPMVSCHLESEIALR